MKHFPKARGKLKYLKSTHLLNLIGWMIEWWEWMDVWAQFNAILEMIDGEVNWNKLMAFPKVFPLKCFPVQPTIWHAPLQALNKFIYRIKVVRKKKNYFREKPLGTRPKFKSPSENTIIKTWNPRAGGQVPSAFDISTEPCLSSFSIFPGAIYGEVINLCIANNGQQRTCRKLRSLCLFWQQTSV